MKENNSKFIRGNRASKRQVSWIRVAPVILPLVWAGCNPAAVKTTSAPSGTYALVSIDGKPVPGMLEHEGHRVTVKSGVLFFTGDGKCNSKSVFVVAPGTNEIVREVNATCTQDGSKLRMRWEGAGMTKGSFDGNNFTMNNEGMIFTYRKSPSPERM